MSSTDNHGDCGGRSDEYEGIVKSMAEDLGRTEREREIEQAFGEGTIKDILQRLNHTCKGNRSEMIRRINTQLNKSSPGEDVQELSRGTLYNYLDRYDLK